jgi:D-alanyl-D-alanine carboxypeptidase
MTIATERVQGLMANYISHGGVGASMAYAIADGPVETIVAGVADRVSNASVTPDSLFKIGSCTKTFFVAAYLQLLKDQNIPIQTLASCWFPDVPGADKISLVQLVNHRNGLPEFEYGVSMDFNRHWTPTELVDLAFEVGEQKPSGGPAVYNNTGYALAGILLETLSGKSVGAYVREIVLEPLGLHNTWSPATEPYPDSQLVRGHYHRPKPDPVAPSGKSASGIASGGEMWRMEGVLPYSDDLQDSSATFPYSAAFALGDMLSTPTEMVVFMRSLFGGKVVPDGLLKIMSEQRAPVSFPGTRMRETGAGMFVSDYGDRSFYGHQGSIPGYVCAMQHSPESGLTIAMTTNIGSGNRMTFQASGLHNVIDDAIRVISAEHAL